MELTGEYECTLDAKGRVLLPTVLKRQIPPEAGDRFVINRGFERCLVLYPYAEWEPVSSRVKDLDPFDADHRRFDRVFRRGASIVLPDTMNRILIPRTLIEFAGLKKDVIMLALSNRIEIWEKIVYETLLDITPEEYSDLASRVMQKKKDNSPHDHVS